jgi:hypothetical protein
LADKKEIKMAWKAGPDGFEFEGKIVLWVRDFQKWYTEDVRNNLAISEPMYLQYITLSYASLAKGKWEKEWLGKRKAERLDSFNSVNEQGQIIVKLWDLLDFIAENIDDSTRRNWANAARSQTKKLLNLA